MFSVDRSHSVDWLSTPQSKTTYTLIVHYPLEKCSVISLRVIALREETSAP